MPQPPSLVVRFLVIALFLAGTASAAENWVENPAFAEWTDTGPVAWTHANAPQPLVQDKPADAPAPTTARIDIANPGSASLGEIRQTIAVRPNQRFRASIDVRSTTDGGGLLMIKLRTKSKELKRLTSSPSTQAWTTLSIEFETGEADNVQVLCRYSQRPEAAGKSVWFTNATLEALDGSAPPKREPASQKKSKPAAPIDPAAVIAKPASDLFVSPAGAGDRSGRDMTNARPAKDLQADLDAVGSGNTLWIGSGVYDNVSLMLTTGGSAASAMKMIAGVDTGGGLPVFRSTFDKTKPAKSGVTFLSVAPGVSHFGVRDLVLENHSQAISLKGRHSHVRIDNIDVTGTRDAFWIEGGATAAEPDGGSRDIEIRGCDVKHFTKRAVRIFGGNRDVRIIACTADAGGKEWAVENFPIGYHVTGGDGVEDRDITFIDCIASNAWHDNGDKYWNADGFAAERGVRGLKYIRCSAFGNTDGGWDLKATDVELIDCVSIDNKRNYRFWTSVKMVNCLGAFSRDRGGRGHDLGLWLNAGAGLHMERCTLYGDRRGIVVENADEQTKPFAVTLDRCVVAVQPDGAPLGVPENGKMSTPGSMIGTVKDAALKAPSPEHRTDDVFDPTDPAGPGYRSTARGTGG